MLAALRRLPLLALIASAVAATLAASPSPAHACSYDDGGAGYSEPDPYKVADVIAKGRIETDPERNYRAYKFWTFRVDRVYKGDIAPRVELRDFARTTCCDEWWPWRKGDEIFVLAEEINPTILLLTCRQGSLEEAERIFGTGYEPNAAHESRGGDVVASGGGASDGAPPTRSADIALTVGAAGFLAVSLVVAGRRSRRSASVAPSEQEDT